MYKVINGKGTGKTKALLTRAYDEEAIVLCKDVQKMQDKAIRYHLFDMDIRGYHDLTAADADKKIYVHDLEAFAKSFFGETLQGYSFTLEAE